jgi:hypothetical protein
MVMEKLKNVGVLLYSEISAIWWKGTYLMSRSQQAVLSISLVYG